MRPVQVLQQLINHIVPEPSTPPEGFEKAANKLAERHRELVEAGSDEFAVILWDGGATESPRYPVATEEDIRNSKVAFEAAESMLPDEVVRVVRYHLDRAAREKLGEALYEDRPAKQVDNVVHTPSINLERWEGRRRSAEQAEKTASSELRLFSKETHEEVAPQLQLLLDSPAAVKQAEAALSSGRFGRDPFVLMEGAVNLHKAAQQFDVELQRPEVKRFVRTSFPRQLDRALEGRRRFAQQSDEEHAAKLASIYEAFQMQVDEIREEGVSPEKVAMMAVRTHFTDQLAGIEPVDGETRFGAKQAADTPSLRQSAIDLFFPEEEVRPRLAPEALTQIGETFGEEFAEKLASDYDGAMEELAPSERRLADRILDQHGTIIHIDDVPIQSS